MNEKIRNMKGQLQIMKSIGIKPNFSELERALGINRHTIKKYYNGYEGKPAVRNKPSKLDKYYEEIKSKINLCGVNQMAVYQYLFQKDNTIGTYSNFKKYIAKKNLKPNKTTKVHLRYETGEILPDVKDICIICEELGIYEAELYENDTNRTSQNNKSKNHFGTDKLYVYFNDYNFRTKQFAPDKYIFELKQKQNICKAKFVDYHDKRIYLEGY